MSRAMWFTRDISGCNSQYRESKGEGMYLSAIESLPVELPWKYQPRVNVGLVYVPGM